MDDNLAQLLAYAVAKERSHETEANGDSSSIRGRGLQAHVASEQDLMHRISRQVETKQLADKQDLFAHTRSTPNLFSAAAHRPADTGFHVSFERAGRDPQKNETWDDNFAELFSYSPCKVPSALTVEFAESQEDASNLGKENAEEEENQLASCPAAVKDQTPVSSEVSRESSAATHEATTARTESSSSVTEISKTSPSQDKSKDRQKYEGGCAQGWTTDEVRNFWFMHKNRTSDETDKAAVEKGMSLVASTDANDPIYYWQLYSVLGPDRIKDIVHTFYRNIYADDDPILRSVFQRLPGNSGMDHHVRAQTAFWIDAFGGGRQYPGGWSRVEFHHRYGASEIMNVDGATRWALHMNRALMTSDLTDDPRVKASLCDFLTTHMDKYGAKFRFDTRHIKFGDTGLRGAMRFFNRRMVRGAVEGKAVKKKK